MMAPGSNSNNQLILHVGTEKTGSSAIQWFLRRNRLELTQQGYALPAVLGEPEHWRFPLMFYGEHQIDDLSVRAGLEALSPQERALEQASMQQLFSEEIQAQTPRTWLVSSEHIHSRLLCNQDCMARLAGFVSQHFDAIRILVYLRDPVGAALSLWSTAVLGGSIDQALPAPDRAYYHHLCHHRNTLETIEHWFPGAVMARLYLPEEFPGGNILPDYAQCCGIDLQSCAYADSERRNRSLSWLSLQLIAGLNRSGQASQAIIRDVRRAFDHYPPPRARRLDRQAYTTAFAASNCWVRDHYFPERPHLFGPSAPESPDLRGLASASTPPPQP
jgi:hypothetical protein